MIEHPKETGAKHGGQKPDYIGENKDELKRGIQPFPQSNFIVFQKLIEKSE
ncbi:MAG: hypothetical protein JW849_11655 [Phycisphaerae bacterium]|nr:hypothetical protein [Phycisphaerae bacterium]